MRSLHLPPGERRCRPALLLLPLLVAVVVCVSLTAARPVAHGQLARTSVWKRAAAATWDNGDGVTSPAKNEVFRSSRSSPDLSTAALLDGVKGSESFVTAPSSHEWSPLTSPDSRPGLGGSSMSPASPVASESGVRVAGEDDSAGNPGSTARRSQKLYDFVNLNPDGSPKGEVQGDVSPAVPRTAGEKMVDPGPKQMVARRLPTGELDLDLRGASNAGILRELKTTGTVYVSMEDPAASGGERMYKYTMMNGGIRRDLVPMTPSFLHHVQRLEEAGPPGESEADRAARIKQVGWDYPGRPMVNAPRFDQIPLPENEVDRSGFRGKLSAIADGLRKAKVALREGFDPRLANVYTTGGIPAIYGREPMGMDKVIPAEARRLAQAHGEVRVFFDPYNPANQMRMVYTGGRVAPGQVAPESAFKVFAVPAEKALPLPRAWQGHPDMAADALRRMKQVDDGIYAKDVPQQVIPRLRDAARTQWNKLRASPTSFLFGASRPSTPPAERTSVLAAFRARATQLKNRIAAWHPPAFKDLFSALRPVPH